MFDLITIGDATIDVFHILKDSEIHVSCSLNTDRCELCMSYADKIPVAEIYRLVAGNAANNAVGAARLGLRTAIYTVLGKDRSGEDIRDRFVSEGVDADYIVTDQDNLTNYSTVLSFQGERTILVYHAPRQYRLPRMQKTAWVYLTSMAAGSEVIFADLAEYLEVTGAKLVYQPGTFQLRLGAAKSQSILTKTELIILNKAEAIQYTGAEADSPPSQLLVKLRRLGARIAIITDGPQGSYGLAEADGPWHVGSDPKIPRREVTGAGDAYAVGVTAALAAGQPLPEAMRWGTMNAESVIQQIGPQAGLLSRKAIEHLLVTTPVQARSLQGGV